MNATDLYIYAGTDITSSGVISEGIGYNKLILAANLPYIQEINQAIPCIYTFAEDSESDLLTMIKTILASPDKNNEMIANTESYKQLFSYEKAAHKTNLLYEKVLHGT